MRLIAVVVGVLVLGMAGVLLFADLFLRSDDSNLLVGFVGLVVSVGELAGSCWSGGVLEADGDLLVRGCKAHSAVNSAAGSSSRLRQASPRGRLRRARLRRWERWGRDGDHRNTIPHVTFRKTGAGGDGPAVRISPRIRSSGADAKRRRIARLIPSFTRLSAAVKRSSCVEGEPMAAGLSRDALCVSRLTPFDCYRPAM